MQKENTTNKGGNLDQPNVMPIPAEFVFDLNGWLLNIVELESQGKEHLALKEIHQTIRYFIDSDNIKIIDEMLQYVDNEKISLTLLIGFLTATYRVKDKLVFRDKIFLIAEEKAIKKYGKERLSQTIFKNIK